MGFWRPSRRRLATGLAAALTMLGSAAVAAPHHRPASLRPPAPTFASYPIPDSLGSANNSGEPSLGVDWRSGAVLYQAGFATYRLKLTDGTWTDVSSPYTGFNLDPILVTDPWSGVTLAGGDDGSCSTCPSVTTPTFIRVPPTSKAATQLPVLMLEPAPARGRRNARAGSAGMSARQR